MTLASKLARLFWIAILVLGLAVLGIAVRFSVFGPEMIILTLLFGGAGIYIILEAIGHVFSRFTTNKDAG